MTKAMSLTHRRNSDTDTGPNSPVSSRPHRVGSRFVSFPVEPVMSGVVARSPVWSGGYRFVSRASYSCARFSASLANWQHAQTPHG